MPYLQILLRNVSGLYLTFSVIEEPDFNFHAVKLSV